MSSLFFRNPRLLTLTIALILVSGLSSFYVLPRMEDPLLTERVALVSTPFPGADAERVESLVTEKLEEELQEIEEIKELRSLSRSGISTLIIELRDDVYEVDTVWSRVRDKLSDAAPHLPNGTLPMRFEQMDMKAYAMIVALVTSDENNTTSEVDSDAERKQASELNQIPETSQTPEISQAQYAIVKRLAKQLEDRLLTIDGTEEVDTYGDPREEILVEVDQAKLTPLGLTVSDVSRALGASDSKISAGQLRSEEDLLIEVAGEFDSLQRVRQTPIQSDRAGGFVRIADVATVSKGIQIPPDTMSIVNGRPAIALGVLVRPSTRVDHWTSTTETVLSEFESEELPRGVELHQVFAQNDYVETRLSVLLRNLILGGVAVTAVIFVMMGWRSALIVGSTLPLAALMVMTGMRLLNIPIHQMSVTGLIIALGLLIDNAIVMVDEVNHRLRAGDSPINAVSKSVGHLALPLFGSTITTALAFAPIALMPGPAGEFVSSIAVSVILAIFSSLFLALTVTPALTAMARRVRWLTEHSDDRRWWRQGWSSSGLANAYRRTLDQIFARPWIGIAIGVALPILGFSQAWKLPEQFFPPSDRDQFYIELELAPTASIRHTLETAAQIRDRIQQRGDVAEVTWFLGESSPIFYYNVVPRRRNTANYGQALIQLEPGTDPLPVIHEVQEDLDAAFTGARVLVRQLEQGPPFDAPVEVRVYGPDLETLREIGDFIRGEMAQLSDVVHTRSDLGDTIPKMTFDVDEEEARMAGLDRVAIAQQLASTLEGSVAGSILEATEELPVRVRVNDLDRSKLDSIASLELVPDPTSASGMGLAAGSGTGVPVSALASLDVVPLGATVPRFNNRRMNEVQAYTKAGVLPAKVLGELKQRLADAGFEEPPGYQLEYGGEAAKRDDAIGNLLVNVGTLMVIMVATLVLSFRSFRMAGIILTVAGLSVGLGLGALWAFGYPMGFMAIIGTMGLVGIAINDTIVVLAAIEEEASAASGDVSSVREVVVRSTRHVVATSLTTMAGFIPLLLGGGGFWPPLAVAIAGGVGGATILALYFAPSAYLLIMRQRTHASVGQHHEEQFEPELSRRTA